MAQARGHQTIQRKQSPQVEGDEREQQGQARDHQWGLQLKAPTQLLTAGFEGHHRTAQGQHGQHHARCIAPTFLTTDMGRGVGTCQVQRFDGQHG